MGIITLYEKKIVFQRRDELTVLEPYGKNCIRCRSTRNSKISEEKWTLLEPAGEDECQVEGDATFAKMTNGNVSVTVELGWPWYGGIVSYYRKGELVLRTKFEGDYVMRNQHREGSHYQIKVIFESNEGEHFYGLGQETENQFDRKGCSVNLLHYNTKSAVPVYYSSLGYGFFWNNPAPGYVELTKNHTMWVADSAYQADYLVYAGNTPMETMKLYCDLTGYAPKFPEWAAGFWQSRLRYESQQDLLEVAHRYQELGVQLAAIVIDYFHWTEQGEWKFEPSLWPDPKAMTEELERMNIKPIVSIWPTINPASENYGEMNDRNLLVRTENGQYGIFEFYGQQTFIDCTNPECGPFVWDKVKKNYYDNGIKNYWLDEAEPEVHPQQFSNLKFYAGNGAQAAMLYPYYYSKMFYDGLKSAGEEEIILLTRAAYPGTQRWGSLVWNGDIASDFRNLQMSIKSGLSMAMCGIPWWNSDIGGFGGGDIESEEFRDLIVRWFQFGVFSPVMRLHGSRLRPKDYVAKNPGVKEQSGGDNEIWSFGERNYPILKALIELRYRLKPYILKYMEVASKEGVPIMRPLFLEFYQDEVCYTIEDEYQFGADILFAPIYTYRTTERKVYLPEGRWVDVNSRKVYDGKQWITCQAQINQFIAFVKEEAKDTLELF